MYSFENQYLKVKCLLKKTIFRQKNKKKKQNVVSETSDESIRDSVVDVEFLSENKHSDVQM